MLHNPPKIIYLEVVETSHGRGQLAVIGRGFSGHGQRGWQSWEATHWQSEQLWIENIYSKFNIIKREGKRRFKPGRSSDELHEVALLLSVEGTQLRNQPLDLRRIVRIAEIAWIYLRWVRFSFERLLLVVVKDSDINIYLTDMSFLSNHICKLTRDQAWWPVRWQSDSSSSGCLDSIRSHRTTRPVPQARRCRAETGRVAARSRCAERGTGLTLLPTAARMRLAGNGEDLRR